MLKTLNKIFTILERWCLMFEQILALLVRIDAALTTIAGKIGPNALTEQQAGQIRDGLTALASRAETIAGTPATKADLQGVTVPSVILGGSTVNGSLVMNGAANVDTVIRLVSSNPGVLNVPGVVTIPRGVVVVAFPVTATNPATDTPVTVTATNNITVATNCTVTHQ